MFLLSELNDYRNAYSYEKRKKERKNNEEHNYQARVLVHQVNSPLDPSGIIFDVTSFSTPYR